MQIRFMVPILLAATLVPNAAKATPPPGSSELAALKTRLASYAADKPVSATLDIRQSNSSSEDARSRHGHISASLNSDASGLSAHVAAAEFERARSSDRASITDASADTTSSGMLEDFSLTTASSMLDFAPSLLRVLASAKLTGHKAVSGKGDAVQVLSFELPLPARAKKDDDLKDFSSTLKVWLDADGVPRSVESRTHAKYRKFLISFSTDSTRSCELELLGNRLLCRKRHEESGGSGMGQSGKTVTDTTLSDIQAPAS